ncbi:nucleolar protein 4-like [Halichondria panicea]|uniref:nucleolar protein 4-like n=1 Tax=Halichondria panicea TaxID=6063 RepID=UPI00312BC791
MDELHVQDPEVNMAAYQRQMADVKPPITTTFVQPNTDRSDDEESDHNTSDTYPSQMRGRVSPSPYTANTERARQFNAYVRGIIEQKLDIFVPISHQPRDIVSDIIADSSIKFPEFSSCVRKRIRTFLKSYRRSRKLRDVNSGSPQSHTNGVGKDDMVSNTSHSLPMSHYQQESPIPKAHLPVRSSPVPRGGGPANTAVVTIDTGDMDDDLDDLPIPKRMKMSTSAAVTQSKRLVPGIPLSNPSALSISEVSAVRQLITGYRESAAFLQRAADQLETMLHNNSS